MAKDSVSFVGQEAIHAVKKYNGLNDGKIIMDGDVNTVSSKYMEFITSNASDPMEVLAPKEDLSETVVEKEFNPINRFGDKIGTVKDVRVFKGNTECEVFETELQ